jgi:hypothetical protein
MLKNTIMKYFLQIFTTKIGWLGITLLLTVIFGHQAYLADDKNYDIWYNLFKISIIYPILLTIIQLILPIINYIKK